MKLSEAFRRTAAWLALTASLGVGLAPHHHAGLWEYLEGAVGGAETHEVLCAHPTALHWHRDRILEPDACLACLRHRLSTGQAVVAAGIPVLAAEPAPAAEAIPHGRRPTHLEAARGPPPRLLAA